MDINHEEHADLAGKAGKKDAPLFIMRVSRKAGTALGLVVLGAVLLAVVAFSLHWWGLGLSPEERAEQEVSRIVSEVERLIVLPEGETPIVATITDAAALMNDQPFYENAENGDVLLVFNQAQRVILYRPSADRLINVAPIFFNQEPPAVSGESVPAQ